MSLGGMTKRLLDDAMPYHLSRRGYIWSVAVPVLCALFMAGISLCFPQVRLLVHAQRVREISHTQGVDAHRFDPEWFDAARAGRVDILRALYEAHYPINSQTQRGYTAVILAAYNQKPEALAYLLSIGADACQRDGNGNTALMGAIYKGHADVARTLLEAPCPIDQINHAGETALAFAALFGRLDVLSELVGRGADPTHTDSHGHTPLDVALQQGNEDAVRLLRKLGATH